MCWAKADNYVVGPGATLTFHAPASLDWSAEGETKSLKGTTFTWKATGTPRAVIIRGVGALATQNIEHRVEIVPARLEVKRQNSPLPWRTTASVIAGGVNSDEDYARYRVVFPTQKDPLRPLPIGPIVFAPTLNDGSRREGIRPLILPNTPTTGRVLSGSWGYTRLKIHIDGSQNQDAAALLFQEGDSGSQFSDDALIQWGQAQKVSFSPMFYVDINGFLTGPDRRPRTAPLRGQKIGLNTDSINVLHWDTARRDFVAANVDSTSPEWKRVSSLVQFLPVAVISHSGIYKFRRIVKFDPDWLVDTVSYSATFQSQYVEDYQQESSWNAPSPTFAARLKSPGRAPALPVFSRDKVRAMLREIGTNDNAPLLRVGLFGGHAQTSVSLTEALMLVKTELANTTTNSRRWLLLQRLRAWGLMHQRGGKCGALAVYAGTLGRSKFFIEKGWSRDVRGVYEDWQDGINGPLLNSQVADVGEFGDAASVAFETFLRLGMAREMPFDESATSVMWQINPFGLRVARLEKDPMVAKNFWFRLGAGEVLANQARFTDRGGKIALLQLRLARALVPRENKAAVKRLYRALRVATENQEEPRWSKEVQDAWGALDIDKSYTANGVPPSSYKPLSDEERHRLEKIRDSFVALREQYRETKREQLLSLVREAIAHTGEGYTVLFNLNFTPQNRVLTSQVRQLLAEIAQKASYPEVLAVAKTLLASLYDPDWELRNLPPASNVSQSPKWEEMHAQNQQNRAIDRENGSAGRALLVDFLMDKRTRTAQSEFDARLQLARFDRDHGQLEQARTWVSPVAPTSKAFDDYRAAQKNLKTFVSER